MMPANETTENATRHLVGFAVNYFCERRCHAKLYCFVLSTFEIRISFRLSR
jgi:hypothetical protein